ncbi:MAG: 4Fe-4S dicluster domain-containing protein [Nitrospirae bacterium]|nr:MAG: 4Fe-4S dicluster domain-containing protein [Nitrospirota bacterium]
MKGKIEINFELCKGCGYCIIACPKKILEIGNELNSMGFTPPVITSPEKCTGCCLCAECCPEVAIEVWREETVQKD